MTWKCAAPMTHTGPAHAVCRECCRRRTLAAAKPRSLHATGRSFTAENVVRTEMGGNIQRRLIMGYFMGMFFGICISMYMYNISWVDQLDMIKMCLQMYKWQLWLWKNDENPVE